MKDLMKLKNTPRLAVALTVLLVAGCGDAPAAKIKTEINIGTVIGAKYTQESFSTWAKTEVETNKGTFVLWGTVSVINGDAATLRIYDSGKKVICFEAYGYCAKIWGS